MRSVHRFAGIGLPDRHPGHYPIEQLLIPIEGTAYTSARPDSSRSPDNRVDLWITDVTDEALAQSAAQYKALLAE